MQKTLDTIISEKQSEAIKNSILLHTLSAICYIIDVSNKLNYNLCAISLELIGILSFLLCVSTDTETNPFAWLKMYTPISNPKVK